MEAICSHHMGGGGDYSVGVLGTQATTFCEAWLDM